VSRLIAFEGDTVGGLDAQLLPSVDKALSVLFRVDYALEGCVLIILDGNSKDIGSRSHANESIKVNTDRVDGVLLLLGCEFIIVAFCSAKVRLVG